MTDENTEITATADGYAAVLNNIIREEDSKKAYDGPPAQRRVSCDFWEKIFAAISFSLI